MCAEANLCWQVLGVKQPALGSLLEDKTYCFFSHVIKAQPENMALLDEALSKQVRLVDYECVREGGGGSSPRLIAFGEFAGKAGMVSGLRGLGLRLLSLGHSTPFLSIGPPHSYAGESRGRACGLVPPRAASCRLVPPRAPCAPSEEGSHAAPLGRAADYADARRALRAVGERVASQGVPAEFSPLVVCVAGTGNVSRGAVRRLGLPNP